MVMNIAIKISGQTLPGRKLESTYYLQWLFEITTQEIHKEKKDMNQIIYANSLNKELISLLPIKFPQSLRLKKHLD